MKQEFIKAVKDGLAYDYIANNYWNMRKEELRDVLLEYIYLYREEDREELLENLEERLDD